MQNLSKFFTFDVIFKSGLINFQDQFVATGFFGVLFPNSSYLGESTNQEQEFLYLTQQWRVWGRVAWHPFLFSCSFW